MKQFIALKIKSIIGASISGVAGYIVYGSAATPNAITKASPGSVTTAAAHGFITGDRVRFKSIGGMVELNGNSYAIIRISNTVFTIGIDTSGFTTFAAGGSDSVQRTIVVTDWRSC